MKALAEVDSCCKIGSMAYLVLARKYRPQTFEEIVGQEHVVRTLKNAIRQGRLAHALLFSGIRGVGKTTIARILAKAINCESGPTDEPCNQCSACQEITEGRAVDVQEIDAASNRGIDEIRELRENVKFRPVRLRSKVYIIDEAHMLTREAFNALLKTLEEPPPHVHFILATTEAHKIPLTILSRCQKYDFRRLPVNRLLKHLQALCQKEGVEIETEALEIIAKEAEGSVRDALSLLDQAISSGIRTRDELISLFGLADRALVEEIARRILAQDIGGCFEIIQQAFEQGVDLVYLAQDLVEFFRHLLAVKASGSLQDLPESELMALRGLSLEADTESLLLIFQTLLRGFENVRRSPLPKLSLELAVAKACEVGRVVGLEEVFQKIAELKEALAQGAVSGVAPSVSPSPSTAPEESASWSNFVEEVKKKSPSLGALLGTLDPPQIQGQQLCLTAPEGSLLEGKDYREKLSSWVREHLGKELRLQFQAPQASSSIRQKLVDNSLVQEALRIFGGRITQVKIYEKQGGKDA